MLKTKLMEEVRINFLSNSRRDKAGKSSYFQTQG